jgi:hypothetical protein
VLGAAHPKDVRDNLKAARSEYRMLKRFPKLEDDKHLSSFDADRILWAVAEVADRVAKGKIAPEDLLDEISIPGVPESAEGYRTDVASPADDEILAAIAQGRSQEDLEVAFWEDRDDLLIKLKNKMADHSGFEDRDYRSFNQSLGIDTKDWKRSEAWQILSPSRNQQAGVHDLNRLIQLEYKGGLIATCKRGRNNSPRPFGDQEIVVTDKVIQISNKKIKAWPRETGLDYVANGEIGLVSETRKGPNSDYLDVGRRHQHCS